MPRTTPNQIEGFPFRFSQVNTDIFTISSGELVFTGSSKHAQQFDITNLTVISSDILDIKMPSSGETLDLNFKVNESKSIQYVITASYIESSSEIYYLANMNFLTDGLTKYTIQLSRTNNQYFCGAGICIDSENELAVGFKITLEESDSNKFGAQIVSSSDSAFYEWLLGVATENEDPYEDGETPDSDSKDTGNDPIDIPDLPSGITGMYKIFNPSSTTIDNLANYMWSSDFMDSVLKLWNDPMKIIISLGLMPFNVSAGSTAVIKAGNVSTPCSAPIVTDQFQEVDCGTIKLNKAYNSYLDFDPYTKYTLYLPFIGFTRVSANDVAGKTVGVKYHIDCMTGDLVCYVTVGGKVFYQHSGNCLTTLPFSEEQMGQVYLGAITAVASIAVACATAGAGAGAVATGAEAVSSKEATNTAVKGVVAQGAIGGVNSFANARPEINHGGGLTGSRGLMSVKYPYFIIERPNACVPTNQNKYLGYPSFKTREVSNCSGYTEFANIKLENINCTDSERSEIESMMLGGIYL